jgi:hypothetical protein
MSEKLCGTCKWFKVDNPYNDYRMPHGRGTCTRFEERGPYFLDDADDAHPVYLTSREDVSFDCLPSFGCILWEKKEGDDE